MEIGRRKAPDLSWIARSDHFGTSQLRFYVRNI